MSERCIEILLISSLFCLIHLTKRRIGLDSLTGDQKKLSGVFLLRSKGSLEDDSHLELESAIREDRADNGRLTGLTAVANHTSGAAYRQPKTPAIVFT